MRTWRCLVEHHLDPCAQWMLGHRVASLIPGGHPQVALQTWVQYTRSMKVGFLHLFTICSIPDFQFFTSNSVRDLKFLMMLNDNFLWLMNLHTDIKKSPPYSAENFYITNLYKHWILFCLDTISSSVLVDRTAERNIMTDQTSECDSVSLAFMPLIHNNCSHYI